jgi:hypothetical protein
MRNAYKILVQQEDLSVDGRIILKWILNKYGVRVWAGFIWLRIGSSGGFM